MNPTTVKVEQQMQKLYQSLSEKDRRRGCGNRSAETGMGRNKLY